MIALDNALVMKGLLLPRMYFFFLRAWWLSTSWQILKNGLRFLTVTINLFLKNSQTFYFQNF